MKTTTQQIKGLTLTMITASVQLDMVNRALTFPDEFKWTQQGLGMVRTKLTRALRLHIWHPSFLVEAASKVHNHPWNFTSRILAGRLSDITFTYQDLAPQMVVNVIECGANAHVKDTFIGHIAVDQIRSYKKGDCYSMFKEEFHSTSIGITGCLSLIDRDLSSWENDDAEVLTYPNEEWVSAAPVDLSPERIRQILLMPFVQNLIKEFRHN
jgi:hypothetical protein